MSQILYRHVPTDLGLEPPLLVDGASLPTLVYHRVNIRWLVSIILASITGAGLMVMSVAGALGPLRHVVSPAQFAKSTRDEKLGINGVMVIARRSDKLIRRENVVAARRDYKASVQIRLGDADITRNASFTRLSTPLAVQSLGFSDTIPAFNLARLVSLASEERAAGENDAGLAVDSEVALSTRDIGTAFNVPSSFISMKDDDAYLQVIDMASEHRRDTTRDAGQSRLAKVMRAPSEGTNLLSFSSGVSDPFSRLVVRTVPENVTLLPRQEAALTPIPIEEKLILTRNEATTIQALRAIGANQTQIRSILEALGRGRASTIKGTRILKLTLQPSDPGGAKELMRVELYADDQLVASAGRRDDGSFLSIEAYDLASPSTSRTKNHADEEEDTDSGRLTLYSSIYETARRHDISPTVIDDAIRAIFFDVDLQRRVTPGDSIEMLIANGETENTRPELLLLSLNAAGTKRRYYRFKPPEDEVVDFFDEQGRSVKQFLMRKPIDGGELRSTFGMRHHPILGYYRMHTGVDWAAPVGTPIRAAGNGTIRSAEWDSGYGRRVEIEHANGYVTTYSHLSAFGPGITVGTRVRQGQIVGRLGSTGLSTGPHLHYEVFINENPVDPLAIKLPKGRELIGRQLVTFKRKRDQIEATLKAAPGANALIAQN